MEEFRVLELFSGIGGMHYAFQYSQLPGSVVAAVDINTVANEVYKHNNNTTLLNKNIQALSVKSLEKMGINMLLMSPPCQPHTRVGQQRDLDDKRSDALKHVCEILPQISSLQYILMENVRGFESSQAHDRFIRSLEEAGYFWQEFILSPTQFAIPNTRHRYYCIARKMEKFPFNAAIGHIWKEMPDMTTSKTTPPIQTLLEEEATIASEFYLTEQVLDKRVWLLDIVTADATNTMCFTKAYTHYSEGTGSVITRLNLNEVDVIFKQLKQLENQIMETTEEAEDAKNNMKSQRLGLLKSLHLRYFTPSEVARLMSFPESFNFPNATTNRQKYRLLGNSINVLVVGELIKLLCSR